MAAVSGSNPAKRERALFSTCRPTTMLRPMDDKKKILVVDDEAQIIRVLRHILNAHGYAVRAAEDGEAALEVFREWTPELVLTDLQMPNIDGLELCRRVRKISDVPIIVLSVRNDEKTIVH